MEYKNILRTERQSIKDNFIKDFTAKNGDTDCYIKVSLHKSWIKQSPKVKKINVSDYEETIIKFLESPNENQTRHPLLIIVGGAGSGKSSSIRYALSQANICNGCSIYGQCNKDFPSRIFIDYLPFKSEITSRGTHDEPTTVEERENRFWLHAIKIFEKIIGEYIPVKEEVSKFWSWLVTSSKARYSFVFYKLLFPKAHLFKNPEINSGELGQLRERLFETLTSQELAYYTLCKVAYLRENQNYNCNVIVFDNIDTLDPFLQVRLIDFATEAYRLFGCKSVIPVRPYTFHLNIEASDFIEVIEHCLPSVKDVIEKRLEFYSKYGKIEVVNSLSKLMKLLFEGNKLWREIYDASAGDSIRFGLRNLYNFMISPLIITHVDDKEKDDLEINSNVFFQAFFCTETTNEHLYETNFVNILITGRATHSRYLSTIKLRTLFFIEQYKETTVSKLVNHLSAFGYDEVDILNTINEFLEKRKALLWSSMYAHYDLKTLSESGSNSLVLTPMGESYFEKLIGQWGYIRECVVAFENFRDFDMNTSISKTIDTMKDLFEIDLKEIEIFCESKGVEQYKSFYRENNACITLILWNKMLPSLQKVISLLPQFEYDKSYGNYMRSIVNKHLSNI